jgi:hypothetical protein
MHLLHSQLNCNTRADVIRLLHKADTMRLLVHFADRNSKKLCLGTLPQSYVFTAIVAESTIRSVKRAAVAAVLGC